jgi:hypothetical protein
VQSDADIETAVAIFSREPGGGLIAIPDSFTLGRRDVSWRRATACPPFIERHRSRRVAA